MAFVVEDGTGLTNSNGYIDAAYFKAYWQDRGTIITAATGKIQEAIVRASDFMDARWRYVGVRKEPTQNMQWPRIDAHYIDGRLVPSDEVPNGIQESCADYAKLELDTPGALTTNPTYDDSNVSVTKRRDKVGPIEEEREFGAAGNPKTWRKFPKPDQRLRRLGLVISGNRLLRS